MAGFMMKDLVKKAGPEKSNLLTLLAEKMAVVRRSEGACVLSLLRRKTHQSGPPPQAGMEQSEISSDEGKHRTWLYAGRIRRGKAPPP